MKLKTELKKTSLLYFIGVLLLVFGPISAWATTYYSSVVGQGESRNNTEYVSAAGGRESSSDDEADGNLLSFSVGGLLGAGFLDQDRGASLNYGGRLGISMDEYSSFGVYYSRLRLFSKDSASAHMNLVLGEANLFFDDQQEGLYIGGKGGVAIVENKAGGVSSTDSDLALGPAAGFEYGLSRAGRSRVHFGTEASYIFVTASGDPDVFSLLGTIRIVFQ